MANINSKCRKNNTVFWKFVNGSIEFSVRNKIETLPDESGISFSSQ